MKFWAIRNINGYYLTVEGGITPRLYSTENRAENALKVRINTIKQSNWTVVPVRLTEI